MAKHIYCHIPFCASKCPYCDFFSVPGMSCGTQEKVIDSMIREIRSIENDDSISTVYIGGGTPSFIPAELIVRLIGAIRDHLNVEDGAEITIEVNPSSLTPAKASMYREAGINRVSTGVQSLHDGILKTLGRLHDADKASDCIGILKDAGFTNISADLIIAVPGQEICDVIEDLDRLFGLGVKHISTYSLSIEAGTPFYKLYNDVIEDLVPSDKEREMYHTLRRELQARGYVPYEISNAAVKGYESRHNSSYWEGEEYYGIGPGSHGYIDGRRYKHEDNIDAYIIDPLDTDTEEVLTEEDRMREYPFLKLRTAEGISVKAFAERFGIDFHDIFGDALSRNIDEGYIVEENGYIRLTPSGIDWSNKVAADFL